MLNPYVTILTDDDVHLRMKSETVSLPLCQQDEETLENMLKYIVDSHDEKLQEKYALIPAVGLAAPQLGSNRALITVYVLDEDKNGNLIEYKYALANPKIISHSEQNAYLEAGEGCLSVKNKHEGYVKRHARITVQAYDYLQKKEVTIRAKGYLAVVLQHEIDHLSGVLFDDHINKKEPFKPIANSIVIE